MMESKTAKREAVFDLLSTQRFDDAIRLFNEKTGESSSGNSKGKLIAIPCSEDDMLLMAQHAFLDDFSEVENSLEYKAMLRLFIIHESWRNEYPSFWLKEFKPLFIEKFSCPSMVEYLKKHKRALGSLVKRYDPNNDELMLLLFAETKSHKLLHITKLRRYLTNQALLSETKGIEIIADNSECSICKKAKSKYKWNVVGDMPILPRHWGCTCYYNLIWNEDF